MTAAVCTAVRIEDNAGLFEVVVRFERGRPTQRAARVCATAALEALNLLAPGAPISHGYTFARGRRSRAHYCNVLVAPTA